MTNSIGDFDFLALHGLPKGPREFVEVLARPGVDGVALWLKGVHGEPFTLRSTVDLASVADAPAAVAAYRALIGEDPQELIWCGLPSSGGGWKAAVLDVRPVRARAVLAGVGGLNPPSRGWLECDWDLVAVET